MTRPAKAINILNLDEAGRRLADPNWTPCDRCNDDGSACWEDAITEIPDHRWGSFFCPRHAAAEIAEGYPKK